MDPVRFGAGANTSHNVVGDVGVLTGANGDLRVGLPWQSVAEQETQAATAQSLHEPARLTVVVYPGTASVDAVLGYSPEVAQMVGNGRVATPDWVCPTGEQGGLASLPAWLGVRNSAASSNRR